MSREELHFTGFDDIPILAESAGEVAAGGPERKHRRTGIKMIKRFFLDGIDAKSRRAPVTVQDDVPFLVTSNEAKAPLPFFQSAVSGADIAAQAPVGEWGFIGNGENGH
jgi:hypothetical protein